MTMSPNKNGYHRPKDPIRYLKETRSALDLLASDHRGLRELLERIGRPRPADEAVPRILLNELHDRLASHFRREEQSPLYDELLELSPHLAEKLLAFHRQHAEILAKLGELMADPRDAKLLTAVIARIRRHERAEDELIQRAFTEDIGVGD